MNFTDPAFQACAAEQAQAARHALRGLLEEAVSSRELKSGTDTKELARTVEVTLNGSLMTWGFYQEGTSQKWVRHDLDIVLRPHLTVKRRSRS